MPDLSAALPAQARDVWAGAPVDQQWFLLLVPVGLAGILLASRLSSAIEAPTGPNLPTGGLTRSRGRVARLWALFAIDSFAGGIAVSAFVASWLTAHFRASASAVAVTFAALGLLQTASFLMAPLLADRIGLLNTMVFTHLPSNALLAAVAFAPTLPVAIALLAARTALSQVDVPTRQAYVMALVEPEERTAAAAYTGAARYLSRPFGSPVAAAAQSVAVGLPFLLSGVRQVTTSRCGFGSGACRFPRSPCK